MSRHLNLDRRQSRELHILFATSGIKNRYSVLEDYTRDTKDFTFFPPANDLEPFPGTEARMYVYEREALSLGMAAVEDCLKGQKIHKSEITHLITVSCTGMYAPGLDIDLVEHLGLSTHVERTAINFMGCYAAFNALKLANHIVAHQKESKVLIVAVELCSLHFQKSTDPDTLVSNALFSDGAAAALISGEATRGYNLEIKGFHNDLALGGKAEMGWFIKNVGFEMKLTAEVPEIIKKGIRDLTQRLLETVRTDQPIHHYAIHPGGRKILEVIEEELAIPESANDASRSVLSQYGNMSSPTVLFVLKELMTRLGSQHHGEEVLSFAFGPGLTLESALLKLNGG